MINKHEILRQWVQPFIDGWLYFENIEMYPGARAIVPNYGDFELSKDILGRSQKRYTFAFVGVQDYSQDTNNQNTDNMYIFDLFNEWIINQDKLGNYPNFGDNTSEYKLSPLQNMANVAMISEDGTSAKYMLMVQIDYLEESEE